MWRIAQFFIYFCIRNRLHTDCTTSLDVYIYIYSKNCLYMCIQMWIVKCEPVNSWHHEHIVRLIYYVYKFFLIIIIKRSRCKLTTDTAHRDLKKEKMQQSETGSSVWLQNKSKTGSESWILSLLKLELIFPEEKRGHINIARGKLNNHWSTT